MLQISSKRERERVDTHIAKPGLYAVKFGKYKTHSKENLVNLLVYNIIIKHFKPLVAYAKFNIG